MRQRFRCATLLAGFLLLPATLFAIAPNQLDDFQDLTTQGWKHGAPSPNPPSNVPNGGPAGSGDAFLLVSAGGGSGPGGRLVTFNNTQWTGDYKAAEIIAVRMALKNFGGVALPMRVAVQSGTARYASTTATSLPADGAWHTVEFDLNSMSLVAGGGTLDDTLMDVRYLRILASDTPSWQGKIVGTELGVDDIQAVVKVVPVEPITWGALKTRVEQ